MVHKFIKKQDKRVGKIFNSSNNPINRANQFVEHIEHKAKLKYVYGKPRRY